MESILLLRPDKAGDAIKTLPVLRALRAAMGGGTIDLLASDHNASLFAHEPGIGLHVLPKNWKRMKRENWLAAAGLGAAHRVDKLVNLLCDASEDADELLSAVAAKQKFAASLTPKGQANGGITRLSLPESTPAGRNETENIALLVSQALGIDLSGRAGAVPTGPILTLADEAEAIEKMGKKDGPWLGFCPFAGTTHRTPPLKRWGKFLQRATRNETFEKFYLFGTPADYLKLEELKGFSACPEKMELCFPSSFRTLGAYLKRLDGVVAVDSGPLHLARSLGVTSLGILSGGDIKRWFTPVREGDMLLRRGLFNRFPSSIEMVWAFEKWQPAAARQPALV